MSYTEFQEKSYSQFDGNHHYRQLCQITEATSPKKYTENDKDVAIEKYVNYVPDSLREDADRRKRIKTSENTSVFLLHVACSWNMKVNAYILKRNTEKTP